MGDLLPALRRLNVACMALVHAYDNTFADSGRMEEELEGVRVVRAPCYGRLLYAPVSPSFPLWLGRAIRRFRPELLHIHMPNTSAFWALSSPAARSLPWVIHWHADVVASRLDRRLALAYPFYRPFEQALLSRARSIIVTSPPYLEASRALAPWREKCRIIPLGLDPNRFPPFDDGTRNRKDEWWHGAKGLKAVAIGRMTYYKGHEVLIRALAETSSSVSLVLVGDGERRTRLDKLIANLGVGHLVRLTGRLPGSDLQALLHGADLFCLPSLERTEAFGVTILEAMRLGKPVLSGNIPGSGVGWVVRDRETGMLTPPGDVAALASALQTLAAAPDLLRKWGANGREIFNRDFHINRIADNTAQLYREVL